jgi:hypothetical protein
MSCSVRDALAKQHQAAVALYNHSVASMAQLRGREFDKAWQQAETARGLKKRARRALLNHEREHGCRSGQASNPSGNYVEAHSHQQDLGNNLPNPEWTASSSGGWRRRSKPYPQSS